ncbi:MAG: DUF4019 domain-containing protein [Pseudomonas sp.]
MRAMRFGGLFRMLSFFTALQMLSPVEVTHAREGAAKAEHVAREWLALADRGNYLDGWLQGAASLQRHMDEAVWVEHMAVLRDPLGELRQRRLYALAITHRWPDVPKGLYLVAEYISRFEYREVREILVNQLQRDGSWRVADYQVKPLPAAPTEPSTPSS